MILAGLPALAEDNQVSLALPAAGLIAGREQQLGVRILNGNRPVTDAIARAVVRMPSMPAMPAVEQNAKASSTPGDYGLSLAFAHAGRYVLTLNITPPNGSTFEAEFELEVTAGASSMPSAFGTGTMYREGSGTSWVPESTPMNGVMKHFGPWMTMAHASTFVTFTHQPGKLGDRKLFSTNWVMGSAQREMPGLTNAGKGTLLFRGMLSFEPLTTGGEGYPLLHQTGETYQGAPITNRQHPHDMIMELAAAYSAPLISKIVLSIYAAPAGEPALGPTAFVHRLSAADNPEAPLGHHWQDSTHISSGVITAGVAREWWKLEGSIFTGRERDENRWDIDRLRFDSWSGRLSVNPHRDLSLQISYGFLREPEALHPLVDLRRVTASAMYHRWTRRNSYWATTFVWGRNIKNERGYNGFNTDSYLIESSCSFAGRRSLFTRIERVEKDDLFSGAHVHGQFADIFTVRRLTLGGLQNFLTLRGMKLGIGASIGFAMIPPETKIIFGDRLRAAAVFLRIQPGNSGSR